MVVVKKGWRVSVRFSRYSAHVQAFQGNDTLGHTRDGQADSVHGTSQPVCGVQ